MSGSERCTGCLSEDQRDIIAILNIVGAAITLFASVYIVFCFTVIRGDLRTNVTSRIVTCYALLLGFSTLWSFLGAPKDGSAVCIAQSALGSFFPTWLIIYTCGVAHHLRIMSMLRRQQEAPKYELLYLIVSGIYALVFTIVPWVLGYFGVAGGWCWITLSGGTWRFVQFYIPLFVCWIFCVILVYQLLRKFDRLSKSAADVMDSNISRRFSNPKELQRRQRFIAIPAVLIICFVWGLISRIYGWITNAESFPLSIIFMVFLGAQGPLNAFAYGGAFFKEFRDKYMPSCCADKSTSDKDQSTSNNDVNDEHSTSANESNIPQPETVNVETPTIVLNAHDSDVTVNPLRLPNDDHHNNTTEVQKINGAGCNYSNIVKSESDSGIV